MACVIRRSWWLLLLTASCLYATERADGYREIAKQFERLAELDNDPVPTPNPDPIPDPDPVPSEVGINVGGMHSWDDMTYFRDAFRESRWVTDYFGTEFRLDIPLEFTGWPSTSIPHNGETLFAVVEINADLPIVDNRPFTLIQRGASKIRIAGVGTYSNLAGTKETKIQFPSDTEKVNVEIKSADVDVSSPG